MKDNFLIVESTDINEANSYKSIISDVISDLRLSSSIDCLKVKIIPEYSLFIFVAILKKTESKISIQDICTINFDFRDKKSFLNFEIERERYIPELTSYLMC